MKNPTKTYCTGVAALAVSVFLPWVHLGLGGLLFAFGSRQSGSLNYWSTEWPWSAVLLGFAAVGAACAARGEKPWHGRISLLCAAVVNGLVGFALLRPLLRMAASSGGRELGAFFFVDFHFGLGCPLVVISSVVMTAAAVASLRQKGITILPPVDRAFFRARAKWLLGALAVLLLALIAIAYVHSQRPRHYRYGVSPEMASEANYALIREGMTYEEANACLGRPNHFPPRDQDLKPGKECWVHWANDFPGIPSVGLSITVRLKGGRVVEKSEQHRAKKALSGGRAFEKSEQ